MRQKRRETLPEGFRPGNRPHPSPRWPFTPGGGRRRRGERCSPSGLGRAFWAMPDRAEGARAVLRLVEILGESWIDFANRPQSRAPSGFSRSGRVLLRRLKGAVTTVEGCCYDGCAGRLISHLPLAYSLTVQPMAASSASALRAVWRRFLIAFTLVTSSRQT